MSRLFLELHVVDPDERGPHHGLGRAGCKQGAAGLSATGAPMCRAGPAPGSVHARQGRTVTPSPRARRRLPGARYRSSATADDRQSSTAAGFGKLESWTRSGPAPSPSPLRPPASPARRRPPVSAGGPRRAPAHAARRRWESGGGSARPGPGSTTRGSRGLRVAERTAPSSPGARWRSSRGACRWPAALASESSQLGIPSSGSGREEVADCRRGPRLALCAAGVPQRLRALRLSWRDDTVRSSVPGLPAVRVTGGRGPTARGTVTEARRMQACHRDSHSPVAQ